LGEAKLQAIKKADAQRAGQAIEATTTGGRIALKARFELKLVRRQHASGDGLAGPVGPDVPHKGCIRIGIIFFRRVLGQGGRKAAGE